MRMGFRSSSRSEGERNGAERSRGLTLRSSGDIHDVMAICNGKVQQVNTYLSNKYQ